MATASGNAPMRNPHMVIIRWQYLRMSAAAIVDVQWDRWKIQCRRASMHSSRERCVACEYLWFAALLVIVLLFVAVHRPVLTNQNLATTATADTEAHGR
jgi:hypothetical protein